MGKMQNCGVRNAEGKMRNGLCGATVIFQITSTSVLGHFSPFFKDRNDGTEVTMPLRTLIPICLSKDQSARRPGMAVEQSTENTAVLNSVLLTRVRNKYAAVI